jgi:hypothetical protein
MAGSRGSGPSWKPGWEMVLLMGILASTAPSGHAAKSEVGGDPRARAELASRCMSTRHTAPALFRRDGPGGSRGAATDHT